MWGATTHGQAQGGSVAVRCGVVRCGALRCVVVRPLHPTAPHCTTLHPTAPHCGLLWSAAPLCVPLRHTPARTCSSSVLGTLPPNKSSNLLNCAPVAPRGGTVFLGLALAPPLWAPLCLLCGSRHSSVQCVLHNLCIGSCTTALPGWAAARLLCLAGHLPYCVARLGAASIICSKRILIVGGRNFPSSSASRSNASEASGSA